MSLYGSSPRKDAMARSSSASSQLLRKTGIRQIVLYMEVSPSAIGDLVAVAQGVMPSRSISEASYLLLKAGIQIDLYLEVSQSWMGEPVAVAEGLIP